MIPFARVDLAGLRAIDPTKPSPVYMCGCYACNDEPALGLRNPVLQRMVLCPICGNKRCPRATHHDNACTGSNEPGQPGSRYALPVASGTPTEVLARCPCGWTCPESEASTNGGDYAWCPICLDESAELPPLAALTREERDGIHKKLIDGTWTGEQARAESARLLAIHEAKRLNHVYWKSE